MCGCFFQRLLTALAMMRDEYIWPLLSRDKASRVGWRHDSGSGGGGVLSHDLGWVTLQISFFLGSLGLCSQRSVPRRWLRGFQCLPSPVLLMQNSKHLLTSCLSDECMNPAEPALKTVDVLPRKPQGHWRHLGQWSNKENKPESHRTTSRSK